MARKSIIAQAMELGLYLSTENVSRQAIWQRIQNAKGLCRLCREKLFRSGFCEKHYKKHRDGQRERRRKMRSSDKPLRKYIRSMTA